MIAVKKRNNFVATKIVISLNKLFYPQTNFAKFKPVCTNIELRWAVVVAQLVEQSLPTLEIRGWNPVIGKILYYQLYNQNKEKTKIKKKKLGIGHL